MMTDMWFRKTKEHEIGIAIRKNGGSMSLMWAALEGRNAAPNQAGSNRSGFQKETVLSLP